MQPRSDNGDRTAIAVVGWIGDKLIIEGHAPREDGEAVIPNPIDQNPWAHWRSPMDMMRQG